jgi:hypothetical protein
MSRRLRVRFSPAVEALCMRIAPSDVAPLGSGDTSTVDTSTTNPPQATTLTITTDNGTVTTPPSGST